MKKGRLEAFSDGVLAILITIMVLELKIPHEGSWETLRELIPVFVSYVVSFIYLGIYWNNHHHLLNTVKEVSGAILWANLYLLFWLSLVPFVTGWMGENNFAPATMALYGGVLLMAAIAYWVLQRTIIRKEGKESLLVKAIGKDWKGKLSPLFYIIAIPAAFFNRWLSAGLYILVALMWLIPDARIEHTIQKEKVRSTPE
jgi:uncharacterized membrane protein